MKRPLVEQAEVSGDRQECEPRRLVSRPRRLVSGVAAGLHHGDVHATAAHVLGGELCELRADATPLIVRIDADDVDHAHPLVEGVHADGNETNRLAVRHGDEHIPFLIGAHGSDLVSLACLPVRVQALVDVVAQDLPQGRVDWFPGPQRQGNERLEIVLAELTDDRLLCHASNDRPGKATFVYESVREYTWEVGNAGEGYSEAGSRLRAIYFRPEVGANRVARLVRSHKAYMSEGEETQGAATISRKADTAVSHTSKLHSILPESTSRIM